MSPAERYGRARSPEELFDNLRLSLSNLAARLNTERYRGAPDLRAAEDRDAQHNRESFSYRDAPYGHDTPYDEGSGYNDAEDLDGGHSHPTDSAGGLPDAIRPALELNEAFPGLATGPSGEIRLLADHGDEEPYRPWFMSGEPSSPWWAADEIA